MRHDETSPPRVLRGGELLMAVAGVFGLAGLALSFISMARAPGPAFSAYLTSLLFFLGIPLGALVWLLMFHTARARFVVVMRRLLETVPAALPALAVLFVPVAFGLGPLYLWMAPPAAAGEHLRQLLHHKAPYLNVPFFLGRAAVYFVFFIAVAELLLRWSRRQDASGALSLTERQRKLGAGALPAFGVLTTFAAIDWIMSLAPAWYSTLFGLYVIAGLLVAGMAALIILTAVADGRGWLDGYLQPAHYHSLGKYLFTTVCLWGYLAFSQFMLIWIGNVPEEIVWYLVRVRGPWAPVAIALVAGHFVVPFVLLLSRRLKLSRRALAGVAVWLLAFHYLDVYWLVAPQRAVGQGTAGWHIIPAFIGIGGVALAFTAWRFRGHPVVPVGDPYLWQSARYEPR